MLTSVTACAIDGKPISYLGQNITMIKGGEKIQNFTYTAFGDYPVGKSDWGCQSISVDPDKQEYIDRVVVVFNNVTNVITMVRFISYSAGTQLTRGTNEQGSQLMVFDLKKETVSGTLLAFTGGVIESDTYGGKYLTDLNFVIQKEYCTVLTNYFMYVVVFFIVFMIIICAVGAALMSYFGMKELKQKKAVKNKVKMDIHDSSIIPMQKKRDSVQADFVEKTPTDRIDLEQPN